MPVDPQLLAAYLLAVVVLILTPGPDMLFALGQTLAGGPRRGWAATGGIMLGAALHVAAAAAGVSAAIAASPTLFEALRLAGAGYLLWIGAQAIRGSLRGGGVMIRPAEARAGLGAAFRQGLLTNLTNPKVGLFFLAFLPQFVDPARAPVWLQMLLLGPLLPILALPAYWGIIAGAARLAEVLRRGHAGRWLEGLAGLLFLGLALRLLLDGGR
jgi:threonine/homoserine/homoserine lactone efflux protein